MQQLGLSFLLSSWGISACFGTECFMAVVCKGAGVDVLVGTFGQMLPTWLPDITG